MTQKVVTNDEAVTGSKNFFVAIFGIFGRYVTNLRGTFVENVKKVRNQPTLLYSVQDVHFRIYGILSANGICILNAHTPRLKCVHWRMGNFAILRANRCTVKDFHWLLHWRAFIIGPMLADQYKQIGILRGATSFNMRAAFIKQN
jgi:hypothetical protein